MTNQIPTQQTAQAREDARQKTGEFGNQPHQESGIVPVGRGFRRPGGVMPIPLFDQNALAHAADVAAEDDNEAEELWEAAVLAEMSKHLTTVMAPTRWWQYADGHEEDMDPTGSDLISAIIVTNEHNLPFQIRSTSTITPFRYSDDGTATDLSASDLRSESPDWVGDGDLYMSPQPGHQDYVPYMDDPDLYAVKMRDKLVASGYDGAALGDQERITWETFNRLCDNLPHARSSIGYRVETKTTVSPNFQPAAREVRTVSSFRSYGNTETEASEIATTFNQHGMAAARPEDYFNEFGGVRA